MADDLIKDDRRHDQTLHIVEGRPEETAVGASEEIFDPARGVHDVHSSRSGSRSKSADSPRRNPSISFMDRLGKRMMENSFANTLSRWPGLMPREFRTSRGITI